MFRWAIWLFITGSPAALCAAWWVKFLNFHLKTHKINRMLARRWNDIEDYNHDKKNKWIFYSKKWVIFSLSESQESILNFYDASPLSGFIVCPPCLKPFPKPASPCCAIFCFSIEVIYVDEKLWFIRNYDSNMNINHMWSAQ